MENAAQTTEREGYAVGNKAQKIFHFYKEVVNLNASCPRRKNENM